VNDAATSLVNSNEPAIMITDNCAPENNFDNPNTEKNAALPATRSADKPTSVVKFLTLSSIYFSLC
jgi:hypothetical protein